MKKLFITVILILTAVLCTASISAQVVTEDIALRTPAVVVEDIALAVPGVDVDIIDGVVYVFTSPCQMGTVVLESMIQTKLNDTVVVIASWTKDSGMRKVRVARGRMMREE